MKNILITGGAGFIGTHLTTVLQANGHRVTILDCLSKQIHGDLEYKPPKDITFIYGDIRNVEIVREAIKGIDVVYHLAAETGTGQSMYEISRYVDVNEMGTAVLFEELAKSNNRVQFILASSRSIYGEGAYRSKNGDIFQPDSRTYDQLHEGIWDFLDIDGNTVTPIATPSNLQPKPGSIYAATKYSQEMLVNVACLSKAMPCTILRFRNVYGEGQSLRNPYTGIISIFYNRMRQNLPINIFEDGEESRDFVHVSDVVDALHNCLDRDHLSAPLIANIGSGVPTTVSELANTISKICGFEVPVKISGDFRVGDIRHCFADLSCAERGLNFHPKISLKDGLKRFTKWASEQPEYKDKSESALDELAKQGLARK